MVKELKVAVPAIQSDFARLRTVAIVGEELARIVEQEDLLIMFQGLQVIYLSQIQFNKSKIYTFLKIKTNNKNNV